MNRPLLFAILVAAALQAHADESPHQRSNPAYVDAEPYTCVEDSAGCAIIKQNNRRIIEREIQRAARKSNRYESPARRLDSALTLARGNQLYRTSASLLDPSDE